jgi:hypothetical protein
MLQQVIRESLRAAADIFECIIFSYKTTPAVCPENDFVRHIFSWELGYENIISAFNGLILWLALRIIFAEREKAVVLSMK